MTLSTAPRYVAELEYTAADDRQLPYALLGGAEGVTVPGHFAVTPATTGLRVVVAPGDLWITGKRRSRQGSYHVWNDASVTVPLNPSSSVGARIDLVGVQILDSEMGDGQSLARWFYKPGAPSPSPVAPSTAGEPGEVYVLAHVDVPRSATDVPSVTNLTESVQRAPSTEWVADEKRPFTVAAGMVLHEYSFAAKVRLRRPSRLRGAIAIYYSSVNDYVGVNIGSFLGASPLGGVGPIDQPGTGVGANTTDFRQRRNHVHTFPVYSLNEVPSGLHILKVQFASSANSVASLAVSQMQYQLAPYAPGPTS